MNRLTQREAEVLRYVVQGLNNTEIGEIMHISKHTVKAHISVIIEKLNCKNRSELAYIAGKNNML